MTAWHASARLRILIIATKETTLVLTEIGGGALGATGGSIHPKVAAALAFAGYILNGGVIFGFG
jgi:hypothetical protein